MSVVEFLLARIAEDEAVAGPAYEWSWLDSKPSEGDDGGVLLTDERLRAECVAKRQIVALHGNACGDREGDHDCACSGPHGADFARIADCRTLPALAAVYADHPDYDPAWARPA